MRKKFRIVAVMVICLLFVACENKEIQRKESIESETYTNHAVEEDVRQEFEEDMRQKAEEDWGEIGQDNISNEIQERKPIYPAEDYGEIQPYGSEFYYDKETKGFSYNLEMFYLNSEFLYSMNDTLEEFYDGYLNQYRETEDWYMEQGKSEFPDERVPYSNFLFLGIQYIDNDYVSLLFNDVTYMGGAHPYSTYDAITLDRCTGKEVKAAEILGESDNEILEKVSNLMGMDVVADWNGIDFYLQEGEIVFFYRMPGYWEEVVLRRE